MGERGWRTDGDYPGAELHTDRDIVMGREPALTQTNGQLLWSAYVRLLILAKRTLDLPQPESPRDTIFAM